MLVCILKRFRSRFECLFPVNIAPLAALLDARLPQAIGRVDSFVAETIAIRYPAFVDCFIGPRHDAFDRPAQYVREDIGANAIVRSHRCALHHFPGARTVTVWLVIQRTDRAQIDDIRR